MCGIELDKIPTILSKQQPGYILSGDDNTMPIRSDLIEQAVELLLRGLGCELSDPNFRDTPERVARTYVELFERPDTDFPTFVEEYSDFILLTGHRMYSLCPHHLLPVEFRVHLAYVPGGKVLGLSKLARILDECNKGPLLQEKFTRLATEKLHQVCSGAKGTACFIEGTHGCARIRGIRSVASFMTYHLTGVFKQDVLLAERFFQLLRR